MIQLVEGAERQKTPNEIALTILLSALTIIFLVVVMTLKFFGIYSGVSFSVTVLVALLVCLIPTTIGGLLSAIGIAGIDRLVQKNVLAMSGRAVEAAGDVNVLLLDKTGTITLGDRQATEFLPAKGVTVEELADAAQLASLADETPEGRSIVVLAKQFGLRGRNLSEMPNAHFIAFSAQTRMSGVDVDGRKIRKGAADAIKNFAGGRFPAEVEDVDHPRFLPGRDPPGRRGQRPDPWDGVPEGHRQGGLERPVRAVPGDGDQDGDDHRGQPLDGRGDRPRGGRGRLPGGSEARG